MGLLSIFHFIKNTLGTISILTLKNKQERTIIRNGKFRKLLDLLFQAERSSVLCRSSWHLGFLPLVTGGGDDCFFFSMNRFFVKYTLSA